jgi:hypothetical protein
MDVLERSAQALYDLREHAGIRPPVSTWPPSDPDEAVEYRMEARAVLDAANYQGAVEALEQIAHHEREGDHAGQVNAMRAIASEALNAGGTTNRGR